MRITDCCADWTEDADFAFPIQAAGNQYVFIYFSAPGKLHAPYCDVKMPQGACVLFNKHAPVRISFQGKAARFGYLFLQGDIADDVKKYELYFHYAYFPNPTDIRHILQSTEKALAEKHPYYEDLCSCKITELLLTLSQSEREPIPPANAKTNLELLRADMIENCAVKRTTPQMCAQVGMTERTLLKFYRQIFGASPSEDLLNIRIRHAKFMLMTQNLSVKEIADRLGFSSAAAFTKAFKDHTGILPSVYKYSL